MMMIWFLLGFIPSRVLEQNLWVKWHKLDALCASEPTLSRR